MNFIPEDGAEPKPVNPVANPFPVLGLLSAEAPKLKPEAGAPNVLPVVA